MFILGIWLCATAGICDNCLRLKAVSLSKKEFDDISSKYIEHSSDHSIWTKELLTSLNGIKKEKAWKVIDFLQAENKIETDTKRLGQAEMSFFLFHTQRNYVPDKRLAAVA